MKNLCCLQSLSENFSPEYIRTLDHGFDANDYYRHILKREERLVIRAQKNRNVIYNGKTCNIMDVASKYKGAYRMDFKEKSGYYSAIRLNLCTYLCLEKHLI